jgi:dihydroorotase/N-acyl-D-amino-acid deacylase
LIATLLLFSSCLAFAQHDAAASADQLDIVIVNGHIIDGTGSPWYSGDVGIRGGRIASIGNLETAPRKQTIDAHGQVVAPGFIDMLGQSELTILVNPRVPSKIYQGITTEITGEGNSAAPLNPAIIESDRAGFEHLHIKPDWTTFREYFTRLEHQGMGINLASYVGATSVRRMVLGDADVQPTADQLAQMRLLVDHAMQDGAVGVSSALQYAPAPYAKTEELIALASEAGKYGGIYATHMRSEGDAEPAAIDEAVRIGREARIPVEIWHLKAAGKSNWGRMPQLVAQIDAARAAGVDISANTYAYTAWFNTFSAFVPPWAHDGGDAKLIERLKDPDTRASAKTCSPSPARGITSGRRFPDPKPSSSQWCRIPNSRLCRASVCQKSQPCGRRTPSMHCAICSSRTKPSPRSRSSA